MLFPRYSYCTSWETYINGNIISTTSRRYITNPLVATAATKTEDSDDSSEDTDAEAWRNLDVEAGSMELVQRRPQGIAARNSEWGRAIDGATCAHHPIGSSSVAECTPGEGSFELHYGALLR